MESPAADGQADRARTGRSARGQASHRRCCRPCRIGDKGHGNLTFSSRSATIADSGQRAISASPVGSCLRKPVVSVWAFCMPRTGRAGAVVLCGWFLAGLPGRVLSDTALSLAERALGGWVSFLPLRSAGDGRDCLDLGPRWLAFPVLGGPGQGTVADRAAPALPAADVALASGRPAAAAVRTPAAASAGSARTARRLLGLPGRHRPIVAMRACRYAGPVAGSLQQAPVVRVVMTMLWTWGCGRPCGPRWCSKEAATQRWGLTGENLLRPASCTNFSAA